MENSMQEDSCEDEGCGGKHQEGLLVAAEYKRVEEASRGQG
jgi:hypothetical protein